MLDARLRRMIDVPLNAAGRRIAAAGITADQVTLVGFAFGLAAAMAIAAGHFAWALGLIATGRIADGLDGAVARATRRTDRGGFLDIVLDFAFYAAVPVGFAVHDPAQNGLAAAVLLAGFLVNGAAFLAFAVMAEKRALTSDAQGLKSLYYLAGLAEGGETIVCFLAVCLWPAWFAPIALGFAALCFASAAARILIAWRALA